LLHCMSLVVVPQRSSATTKCLRDSAIDMDQMRAGVLTSKCWSDEWSTKAMAINAHVAELERRHHKLEREIADALAHSSTDDLTITELKRQKLQLKDEIERLRCERG
jgi:hypothetical protein